jgi:hypothetical protein
LRRGGQLSLCLDDFSVQSGRTGRSGLWHGVFAEGDDYVVRFEKEAGRDFGWNMKRH